MNSVSIYEKRWLDLVFDGKNKAYGAYQLRLENSKTTLLALFVGVLLLSVAVAIPVIINSLKDAPLTKPTAIEDDVIRVSQYKPFSPTPKKAFVPIEKKPVTDVVNQKQLINPTVVKPTDADQNIATNANNNPAPLVPDGNPTGTMSPAPGTPSPGTNTGTALPVDNGNAIITNTLSLDKLPEFPGGISKFYSFVGNNFEKIEIEGEKSIRVYVSFVIEKDGSMTDIKVGRDPGHGIGKEAIRVLKSLKVKWSPGMVDGKPVRTAYNLPITVLTQ